MTLPDERSRAVLSTRAFLRALLRPDLTPKVPGWIRAEAYACLRHFPWPTDLTLAAKDMGSKCFAPVDYDQASESEDNYYSYLQERRK